MGIAILNELQDRLHTIAIAGTNLLSEDFRLKKTAEQFHTIAASSPVLSKIDQLVQHLFDEQNKEKEISLMEAIALVDAVVCTQADYAVKKENQQDIEIFARGSIKHIKYTELEPVITALTITGKYTRVPVNDFRYNNRENDKYIFRDFRLFSHLINNLGNPNDDLAYEVAFILSTNIGEDVIPLCKKDFDAKGEKDMIRRLEILEEVAKGSENDFYISLLENSSPTIREKVIGLLKYSEQNIDLLIHLAETEKGRCKKTALKILSAFNNQHNDLDEQYRMSGYIEPIEPVSAHQSNNPKITEYFIKQAKKRPQTYFPYLKNCATEEVSDIFADALEKLLPELLKLEEKEEPSISIQNKIENMLFSIDYKCSDKMIDVLEKYGNESKKLNSTGYRNVFKGNLTYDINLIMINNILRRTDEKYRTMIKELYKRCGKVYLPSMLVLEFLTEPEKSYDLCCPYFRDKELIKDIGNVLWRIECKRDGYYMAGHFIAKEMDIRWIEALVQPQNGYWQRYGGVYERTLENWIDYHNEKRFPLFSRKRKEFDVWWGHGDFCNLYELQKLGGTSFKTLIAQFISNRRYTDYDATNDYTEIIKALKELLFTPEDRIEELKLILDALAEIKAEKHPCRKFTQERKEKLIQLEQQLQQTLKKLESGEEI